MRRPEPAEWIQMGGCAEPRAGSAAYGVTNPGFAASYAAPWARGMGRDGCVDGR